MTLRDQTQDLLFGLMFRIRTRMNAKLSAIGIHLSPMQVKALYTLSISGIGSQQQLAETMERNKAQVARLVAKLERQGLVIKTTNAADRRIMTLSLTSKSRNVLASFLKVQRNLMGHLLNGFTSSEIKELNCMLERIHDNYATWQKKEAGPLFTSKRARPLSS